MGEFWFGFTIGALLGALVAFVATIIWAVVGVAWDLPAKHFNDEQGGK